MMMMMTRIVMMVMIIIKLFGDDMLVHYCPRYLVVHLHVELVQVLRAELKQVLTQSCLLQIISPLVRLCWKSCICVFAYLCFYVLVYLSISTLL